MKIQRTILASVVSILLVGCATVTSDDKKPASGGENASKTAASDSRAPEARSALDYRRLGLRLIHSPMGQIEAIEATGYAPVWSASQSAVREANRVAELEAKKIINDFINDETITSGVTVTMISRNIEKAVDRKNMTNLDRDSSVAALTTDQEVDVPFTSAGGTNSVASNRSDAVKIASELKTTITLNNKGILGGLYLVNSEVIDGGKTVRATYRWDRQFAQNRREIRDLMQR